MSPLSLAISLVLRGLPASPFDATEPPIDRAARLDRVAVAIDAAATAATCDDGALPDCRRIWPGSKRRAAATLLGIGNDESKFARHIHLGNCRPSECDPYLDEDGVLRFRAVSFWQIHAEGCISRSDWDSMRGDSIEATTVAALGALRVLAVPLSYGAPLRCALSAYAGVRRCKWSGAPARLERIEQMEDALAAAVVASPS